MNHADSPDSILDIFLAVGAVIVVVWSFYLAVRYTIRPGEKERNHIKRRVLNETNEKAR